MDEVRFIPSPLGLAIDEFDTDFFVPQQQRQQDAARGSTVASNGDGDASGLEEQGPTTASSGDGDLPELKESEHHQAADRQDQEANESARSRFRRWRARGSLAS
jgi:hypothetical protein